MNFATAMENESRKTFTENGATAFNTTGGKVLDLFSTIGALREADDNRICRLFADAYAEDKLLAAKTLFYGRDIREGLGERSTFRTLLHYAANKHPESIKNNICLIAEYGRYDDLYALVGTPLESEMWQYVAELLKHDISNMAENKPVSLLAKWLKSPDTSSDESRALGIRSAEKLNMTVREYRKAIRALRRYLNVTEVYMTAKEWNLIKYSAVPSMAMTKYRKAFMNRDEERFSEFLNAVSEGKEKINASTLFPYDIVEKYLGMYGVKSEEDSVLEAQWKALPNYVKEGSNAIVVADTSGSMYPHALSVALSLAIYFAERNTGAYHNMWMTFSSDSRVNMLKGETLHQKLASVDMSGWGCSTNLEAAFMKILDIAIKNHVPAEEMVKSIVVISDMEIDCCVGEWSFYNEMKSRFEKAGYEIPNVVFWNVESRHDTFHGDKDRKGVQLCSGSSASTFKILMESIGLTPTEMMLKVLNSERYSAITIAE